MSRANLYCTTYSTIVYINLHACDLRIANTDARTIYYSGK